MAMVLAPLFGAIALVAASVSPLPVEAAWGDAAAGGAATVGGATTVGGAATVGGATTAGDTVTVRGEASAVEVALGDLRRLAACEGAAPSPELELQRLRSLYILALADEDRIEPARDQAAALIGRAGERGDADDLALSRAYDGALTVLRAKHGFWPLGRVNHLRSGLRVLDREVEARPDHLEIRYLRLVSTAFLPEFFGRGDSARRDLEVVARLLAGAAQRPASRTTASRTLASRPLPSRTVQAMGDTVLELLDEDDPKRAAVAAALERDREDPKPLAPGCPG
jgi:hypothetical protein